MKKKVRKEVENLIEKLDLNCTFKEFRNKADINYIIITHKVSEDFIREYQFKHFDWINVLLYQDVSNDFVREFKNKYIGLSDDFIKELQNTKGLNNENTL